MLMAVVNPGKMKNVGEIQANLNMWEERISQLETQFKENAISEPLKVAIITSAVPNKVQDYIFSQPEKDPSYAQIKEMIITYSSRMADNGPNAMDIGAVEREEISGTSGREMAGKTISGEKSSGKAIRGENSRTVLFHTM